MQQQLMQQQHQHQLMITLAQQQQQQQQQHIMMMMMLKQQQQQFITQQQLSQPQAIQHPTHNSNDDDESNYGDDAVSRDFDDFPGDSEMESLTNATAAATTAKSAEEEPLPSKRSSVDETSSNLRSMTTSRSTRDGRDQSVTVTASIEASSSSSSSMPTSSSPSLLSTGIFGPSSSSVSSLLSSASSAPSPSSSAMNINEETNDCVVQKSWLCPSSVENKSEEGQLFEEVMKIMKARNAPVLFQEVTKDAFTEFVVPIYETLSDHDSKTGKRKLSFKKMKLNNVDNESCAYNNQLQPLLEGKRKDPYGLGGLLNKIGLKGNKLDDVVSKFTEFTQNSV